MTLIDSHAHLYLKEFAEDLPDVIARARRAGVACVLLPNIDSTTLVPLAETVSAYPNYCYPMIGLHPTSVDADYEKEMRLIEAELSRNGERYVAIGEIGIDLYWDQTYKREQEIALRRQLDWAVRWELPVAIHCRNAHAPLCRILKDYKELTGVFHSFAGTAEEVAELLQFEGFLIGVNGIVTFKNSKLSEVLRSVPLTRLLIETDAPYLAPAPHRGQRNESAYLIYIMERLSQVYEMPTSELANQIQTNTLGVFRRLKSI
ncbi:MAG: TatD family hydrolase [Prevotellaceae bacterium]|jgi:TatD DNase family protein|nr:TatD family hydrolase [Prevotellaceae bacterium]